MKTPDHDRPLTLSEHLGELRARLIKIVSGVGLGMIAGLLLADRVQSYFIAMVNRVSPKTVITATTPSEKIVVYFTIALYIGIGLAMPVLLYQFERFLAPALTPTERRYVRLVLPGSLVCFGTGVLFALLVAVPQMLRFLLNFGNPGIQNLQPASEILGFCANLALWTGLAFQLPLILFLLAALNIVPYQQLRPARRYAAVGLMVLAAVITPSPDAPSMLIIWAPLYLLFELGLFLARFARPRPQTLLPVLLIGLGTASFLQRRKVTGAAVRLLPG